jgi:catechol 2,3-dioxygenase
MLSQMSISAVRHYTEVIGLDEVLRGVDGRVYLKAWDEFDHHSVILREADRPGMDFVGFKVTDDDALTNLGERVSRFGLAGRGTGGGRDARDW